MHTVSLLHKSLKKYCPTIHSARLVALMAGIQAITHGAQANITSLGRGLVGTAYIKHKIKRMDRLVGNRHLYQERQIIYVFLSGQILQPVTEPIIHIDWSPITPNQEQQLLRASVALKGRD